MIRDYQAHMATRRERRLPRVLDWSHVEQIVAAEHKPRDRAILALLAYGGLRRGESTRSSTSRRRSRGMSASNVPLSP